MRDPSGGSRGSPVSTEAMGSGFGWRVDDLDTDEMILNMGPQHPSTHGVLRLELRTHGVVVRAARPHIGYLVRCLEQYAEQVGCPGYLPSSHRLGYVVAWCDPLGY